MHDFSVLSDIEFEGLVADLLAAEFSTSVERFAAGADGGVDLRWRIAGGGLGVGQCKHYSRSSISQLLSAARGEIPHLRSIAPADYWFITSFDVTIAQKKKIFEGVKGWMRSPNQVLGIRDLHGLLTRHEHVERRHLKLWLSTGCQLFW